MKKKKIDKTMAINLINKYADNYKRIESENNDLKKEIKDLKTNLNVNKEIIETFYRSDKSLDSKYNLYLYKLKEEISNLTKTISSLTEEKENLNTKIMKYESLLTDQLDKKSEKSNNEELSNMVFILQNKILKKNNIIQNLNSRLEKQETVINNYKQGNFTKENIVYVSEPNETIILLFNDLNLYKQSYFSALQKIKEKDHIIEKLSQQLENTEQDIQSPVSNYQNIKNALAEMIIKVNRKDWETDEWLAVLNYLNLTKEDINKGINNNNKFMIKIFDGIELLNKIMSLRNKKINELTKEKEKLMESINTLNNENTMLTKKIYMQQNMGILSSLDVGKSNDFFGGTNLSMVNNTSFEGSHKEQNLKYIEDKFSKSKHYIKKNILNDLYISSDNNGNEKLNYSDTLNINHVNNEFKNQFCDSKYIGNCNFTLVSENSFNIIDYEKENNKKDKNSI